MSDFKSIVRNNGDVVYYVPTKHKIGEDTVAVNFTKIMLDAIKADEDRGYEKYGPNAAIEIHRAQSFADYLNESIGRIHEGKLNKLSSDDYTLFILPS